MMDILNRGPFQIFMGMHYAKRWMSNTDQRAKPFLREKLIEFFGCVPKMNYAVNAEGNLIIEVQIDIDGND